MTFWFTPLQAPDLELAQGAVSVCLCPQAYTWTTFMHIFVDLEQRLSTGRNGSPRNGLAIAPERNLGSSVSNGKSFSIMVLVGHARQVDNLAPLSR